MADDFYVDDETPEEIRDAWQRGEKGVTTGPRDLNQRAASIVARAVEQLDDEPGFTENVVLLDTLTWAQAEQESASSATGTVTKEDEPVLA